MRTYYCWRKKNCEEDYDQFLRVSESSELFDEEEEDGLDLRGFLVGSVRRENTEDIRDTAGNQQLDIPAMFEYRQGWDIPTHNFNIYW